MKPSGMWQKVMVMTEYNVCHIRDLLNHHGCVWQSFCYGHDRNKRWETALSYTDTHKGNRDKTRSNETLRDMTDYQFLSYLWLIEPSWMWQSFCYGHDGNKRWETALSYTDTHKGNRDKTTVRPLKTRHKLEEAPAAQQ